MTRSMKWIFSLVTALCAVACGKASTSQKSGTALASLHGKLVANASYASSAPVTLAVAWYPSYASYLPTAPAKAIVTQQVAFQGTFPLDFALALDAPPPAEALIDLSTLGGKGHAAYGVIIAFQDLNGNGALDLIPANGVPIDKIVGSSIGNPSINSPALSYSINYLDGTAGPSDQFDILGAQQGYNLMRIHNQWGVERVPLDTAMSIEISDAPSLNLLACAAEFQAQDFGWATACGIDPYPGGYSLSGVLYTYGNPAQNLFSLSLDNGIGPITGAAVTFDGTSLAYSSDAFAYVSSATVGAHNVTVTVPGHATETFALNMMPPMVLSAPVALVKVGSTFSFSWQPVAGAGLYDITVYEPPTGADGSARALFHQLTTALSTTTPTVTVAGDYSIHVTAVADPLAGTTPSSSIVVVSFARSVATVTQ